MVEAKAASDMSAVEAMMHDSLPGVATFAKFNFRSSFFDYDQVAFLARGESKWIRHLGNGVRGYVKGGLIVLNGVGLIPILIELESHPSQIFEAWLNFHEPRPDGIKNDLLETLCKQHYLPILIYGQSGEERSILLENSNLKRMWSGILDDVSKMRAWKTKDFEVALYLLAKQYPTAKSLWNSMNRNFLNADGKPPAKLEFDDE